jgi:hypothetical protein
MRRRSRLSLTGFLLSFAPFPVGPGSYTEGKDCSNKEHHDMESEDDGYNSQEESSSRGWIGAYRRQCSQLALSPFSLLQAIRRVDQETIRSRRHVTIRG